MKLLVKGIEVPILQLVSQESLSQYYDSYLLTVPTRLAVPSITLQVQVPETYFILREEWHDSTYVYTIVTDKVFALLNTTFPSVTGTFTLNQVLNRLGLRYKSSITTAPCFWHIPSMKFTKLIDYLSTYTVPANGGASYFNLNSDGIVEVADLRVSLDGPSSKTIKPICIDKLNSYRDWITKVPGSVVIYSADSEGMHSSPLILDANAGKGSVFVNDTTGYEADLMRRALITTYYTNKYTSRKCDISLSVDACKVGDCVKIEDLGKWVVYSRTVNVALTEDTPSQVSYQLVSTIY